MSSPRIQVKKSSGTNSGSPKVVWYKVNSRNIFCEGTSSMQFDKNKIDETVALR